MDLSVDIIKKLLNFTLDIQFEAGLNALGLLGASGSGKTMTLRCIAGLEKPDKGRIVLNGRVLFDSEKGIDIPCRKRKIGFVFQNYALFPNMTVEENIGFALERLGKRQREGKVAKMIEMIRLQGMEKRYPSQLSGGQQQRVALARALAIEPEALLLDEPFSALDNHLRSQMCKQLTEILSDYKGVTVFVTHDMEEAYRVCNNLVILKDGSIEAQGNKEKLFRAPPTLSTALLTGHKNFSSANYINKNELQAIDWGIKLKTKEPLTKEIKYVAIGSKYIRLASDDDKDNVFQCRPVFVSESPFELTVYLSFKKEPSGLDDCQLQWDISREMWVNLKRYPLPWKICLDSEKLITFDR